LIGKGDWQDAVKAAIYQPRPMPGWPKPTAKKRASKKSVAPEMKVEIAYCPT
jgi:hypothetical protein